MTNNTDKPMELREQFQECTGYTCNHERSDTHYIVSEDEIKQAIQATREETVKEAMKLCLDEHNNFLSPETEKIHDYLDSLTNKSENK